MKKYEVKSKKDLIEKWESAIEAAEFYGKGKEERLISYMKDFVSDLNQLDEPEVLSQKWIDEHSDGPSRCQYVWVDYLKELLVPKQELPVIPKFVADWTERNRAYYDDIFLIGYDICNNDIQPDVDDWIMANEEEFVRAWMEGYEVEEQKYYVMNNHNKMMLVRMMDGKTITEADPFKLEDMYEGEKKSHRLTEQEIKDYDERYWPFAKKVEELEE